MSIEARLKVNPLKVGINRGPMKPIFLRLGSRRDPKNDLEIHVHMDLDQPCAHVYPQYLVIVNALSISSSDSGSNFRGVQERYKIII